MCATQWSVSQLVAVEPRTWAGINRPGGVAKITKLHYSNGFVESLDVKYIIGGGVDTKLDLDFVRVHEDLDRKGRSRRERDLYVASPAKRARRSKDASSKKAKKPNANPKKAKGAKRTQQAPREEEPNEVHDRPILSEISVPREVNVSSSKSAAVSPLAQTPKELSRGSRGTAVVTETTAWSNNVTQAASSKHIIKKASRPKKKKTDCNMQKAPVRSTLVAKLNQVAERTKNVAEIALGESVKDTIGPLHRVGAKRAPLKKIYESHKDRANDFVEELVGKPKSLADTKPLSDSSIAASDASVVPPTSACDHEALAESAVDEERTALFVNLLSKLLTEDESLDKAEFFDRINKYDLISERNASDTTPFTLEEMESCLSRLDRECKIMVSDGVIYKISC